MNLDFLQYQKMLHVYSFLKKDHFVPSVQRDDFASGVDNWTLLWVVLLFQDSFLLVLSSLNSFPPFYYSDGGSGQILFS